MNTFKLKYQLIESKHYHNCQDVVTHPIVVEAFQFGDFNGKCYDSLEWEGSVYSAELSNYQNKGKYEVVVGEWLGDVNDQSNN